jgi:hypothetical protein
VNVPGILKRPLLSLVSKVPNLSPAITSTLAPRRGRDAVSCTLPDNENTGGGAGFATHREKQDNGRQITHIPLLSNHGSNFPKHRRRVELHAGRVTFI